ncbi:MAG: DUF1631 family protein [Rhodoferax sp.]|nr:DUF1631 family protein [Rhodoferax sp.]
MNRKPAPEDSKRQHWKPVPARKAIDALDQRRQRSSPAGRSVRRHGAISYRGTWFDVVQDDGSGHRCRLSWVSPMRTRLLFTNRDGFDAFVRSEREVAPLLRRGRLSMIDQVPIVSRAIDKLIAGDSEPEVVLVV